MLARTAAAVAVLGALLPAPASAAPTLTPLKACYVSVDIDRTTGQAITENVVLQGSGFTPNALVDVSVDGVVTVSGAQIDGAGNLPAGTIKAPFQASGERAFTVTVTEQANPAQTVSATTRVTDLDVRVKPRQARPTSRITFTGRGFTDNSTVWIHYVKGTRHKKTIKLAAPTSPCGTFKVRRRQFPFNPSTGRWIVQIDQQRKYSRRPAGVFYRLEIAVRRVLRRG